MKLRILFRRDDGEEILMIDSHEELYNSESIKPKIAPEFPDDLYFENGSEIDIENNKYIIHHVSAVIYPKDWECVDIRVYCTPLS